MQTQPTAKTMTLDSKTGRGFLIAAEYGPPTTTPPPGGGRGPMIEGSFAILAVGR
jgi:hypothetical protein